MNCSNCGAELQSGQRFCGSCGSPTTPPEPKVRYCANCGTKLPLELAYCTNCGTPKNKPKPEDAPDTGPVIASSYEPQPAYQPVAPRAAYSADVPMETVEYKGVGRRFLAALVDGVLYFILAGILASFVGAGAASASDGLEYSFNLQGPSAVLSWVIFFAYYLLMEGFLGGTVGKLLLGMRVVNSQGEAPGLMAAFLRNLLRIVDALPLFYLLGIILVATSGKKQRLGDRVAGTYVVSAKSVETMRSHF